MKALTLLISFLMAGCYRDDSDEIGALRRELHDAKYKIDSLSRSVYFDKLFSKTPEYYWFDLSTKGFARVSDYFYLTDVKTRFQPNGITVSGIIGNLEPMVKTNIELTAAIRDSLYNEVIGQSEIGYLGPGQKNAFSVFIPTQVKNITMVGFKLEKYRM